MHKLKDDPNQRIKVDRELIRQFLAMSPEQRLATNDNAIRTIEELRDAFNLKRDSTDPKDRERLPVYEETLKLIRDKK